MKNTLKIIGNILFSIVIIILAFVTFSSLYAKKNNTNPSIAGYSFSIVLTESMSGEIEVGELIVYKSIPMANVKEGDNIVFRSIDPSSPIYGQGVVHKAIRFTVNEDGQTAIVTKGVNNLIEDKYTVTANNFYGIVTYHSMFLGKLMTFLSTPAYLMTVLVCIAIIYVIAYVVKKTMKESK